MILWIWSACTPEPDLDVVIDAERRVVHKLEEALLARIVDDALATGDGDGAALAVAMGLEIAPDRFARQIDRVVEQAGPARSAEVLRRWDRDRARRLDAEAVRLGVLARHTPPAIPEAFVGVTLAHARAVLEGFRDEFVAVPDEAAMVAGARAHLGWVAEAQGRGPIPSGAPIRVEDVIAAAIAHGIPEAIAAAEGVAGALAALDPHARGVWPAEIAAWTRHHEGVLVGVGLPLLDAPDGTVILDVPVVDGPGWMAGLHQGDQLVAVAGVAVADLDSPRGTAATALLAGDPDTRVEITIHRDDIPAIHTLPRQVRPRRTVVGYDRGPDNAWRPWIAPGIAFVRIRSLSPDSDEDFARQVTGLAPAAMVLDLRGNGGGDVMAAVNIADHFVADGVLAHLVGRTIDPPTAGDGEAPWNAALPGHDLEGIPVVVVVDRGTASAAELLAGALRERAGATLVGESTFGKGLSQALRADEATGVAWQVTTGTWTLPSGVALEGPTSDAPQGLEPDVPISLSAAERFLVGVQRDRREQVRVHADGSPVHFVGTVGRPELPRLSVDPQLARALDVAMAALPPEAQRSRGAR